MLAEVGVMNHYGTRGEAHVEEVGKSWRVRLTYNGRRFQRRFQSKVEALNAASLANSILPRLRLGLDEIPARATRKESCDYLFSGGTSQAARSAEHVRGPLLGEVICSYRSALKTTSKERSSQKTEEVHLRHLEQFLRREALLRQPVSSLTASVLRAYQRGRQKKVKAKTVNKETATFGLLLDFADADPNPVRKLEVLPEEQRPPFRTGAEIERLLEEGVFSDSQRRAITKARVLLVDGVANVLALAQGTNVHLALAVAAYTGARRGEIARLTWADVDLDRRSLTVHSKKQSKTVRSVSRCVALNSSLHAILAEQKLKSGGRGYVFPGRKPGTHTAPKTLHDGLVRLLEGTDYEGVGWHTLRHSFITNLARAGVDRDVIKSLVGHVSDQMFDRYRHVLSDEQERALKAVEALRRHLA